MAQPASDSLPDVLRATMQNLDAAWRFIDATRPCWERQPEVP